MKDYNKKNWGSAPQESVTAGSSNGWGNAPQESVTANSEASGWGNAPQESVTGQNSGWGGSPQESTTGSQAPPSSGPREAPQYDRYVIDGVEFHVNRLISKQSGEAIILEVTTSGKVYTLKLYRPGVVPNHEVLKRIADQRGNGFLVDIYSHGKWTDNKTGQEYHYEVMQYCAGGSLADVRLNGDEKKMREYVIRMASALDFAHRLGILHRDVKPANFLFVDKDRSKFVLTDWGLAKTLDEQGRAQTDAGRTKIYAAPEMYTYIPGKPTYVGPKADFFSMGMTLLALWMGEGKLLADETKLVHDKQEETLPYPRRGEMSDHSAGLIKALTRRNPDVRAGLDEVVRWAKGETIFKEKIDDSLAEFKIVFDAGKGLIAHNPAELAEIMLNNPTLATKYLYTDKIRDWFREIERPELAMAIEEITEQRFPADKERGLYVACLTLDPKLPFPLKTPQGFYKINTLKELGDLLIKVSPDQLAPGTFTGEDFLMWVATRDAALAGKVLQAGKSRDLWNVIYNVLPDRAFDFKELKTSDLAVPEQIAARINEELCGNARPLVLKSLGSDFRSSRLRAYLASKGKYSGHINWIEYCLDINSKDNRMKYAPYTRRVAQFKTASGLAGKVLPVTVGGMEFRSPDDVVNGDVSRLTTAQQDLLADWLTLFFQEELNADYKKRSFFSRTSDYSYFIDNLPASTYAQNSMNSGVEMTAAVEYNEHVWRKVKLWRWLAAIFCFLPLFGVCVAGTYMTVTMGAIDLSESLSQVGHWIGIGIGIISFLCVVGSGYSLLLGGITGVLVWVLSKLAFTFIGSVAPWVVIGIMVLTLIFMGKRIFFGQPRAWIDEYTTLDWDEVIDRYVLANTFDCRDKVFPAGLPEDYPVCVVDESSARGLYELPEVRKSALIMLCVTLVGVALCWFTARGIKNSELMAVSGPELLSGQFTGDISGTPCTITFDLEDDATVVADMKIDYRSGTTTQTMVAEQSASLPYTFYKNDNNEIYLRIDNAAREGSTTVATGIYCNSKKNIKQVKIRKR